MVTMGGLAKDLQTLLKGFIIVVNDQPVFMRNHKRRLRRA